VLFCAVVLDSIWWPIDQPLVLFSLIGELLACWTVPMLLHLQVPPAFVQAAEVRDQLRRDPYSMSAVKQNNPPLAAAVDAGDLKKIQEVVSLAAAV
jgi:hypothetical protein